MLITYKQYLKLINKLSCLCTSKAGSLGWTGLSVACKEPGRTAGVHRCSPSLALPPERPLLQLVSGTRLSSECEPYGKLCLRGLQIAHSS